MSTPEAEPIGVLLAGGRGRRMGGAKATITLAGRPLISYPLQAMRGALRDVAVVAKADTQLPFLDGVEVWVEPPEPRHPLVGIVHALQTAAGRPVLVCAADLPFVTVEALSRLARADPGGAPAVVATGVGAAGVGAGGLQPLLACYQPAAAALLAGAAREGAAPLRAAVQALAPRLLEFSDPQLLFNVNSPSDLRTAEAIMAGERAPTRT